MLLSTRLRHVTVIVTDFTTFIAFEIDDFTLITKHIHFTTKSVRHGGLINTILRNLFIVNRFVTRNNRRFVNTIRIIVFTIGRLTYAYQSVPFHTPVTLAAAIHHVRNGHRRGLLQLNVMDIRRFRNVFWFHIFPGLLVRASTRRPRRIFIVLRIPVFNRGQNKVDRSFQRILFTLYKDRILRRIPTRLMRRLHGDNGLFSHGLLNNSYNLPHQITNVLNFHVTEFMRIGLVFASLVSVDGLINVFQRSSFLFYIPLSMHVCVLVHLMKNLQVFHDRFFRLLGPFNLLILPFLLLRHVLRNPIRILHARNFRCPISNFRILSFIRLNRVKRNNATFFNFLRTITIRFRRLSTPPSDKLKRPQLIKSLLRYLPRIRRRLRTLHLFMSNRI